MKRVLTGLLSLMLFYAVGVMASQVAVVDMQKVFQQAPEVKKINDNLTKQFSARRDNIVKASKDFQASLQKFQKNQSVMGSKELASTRAKLTAQETQLRQDQAKFQQDLFVAQDEHMKKFMEQVKTVVQEIAAQKKFDVVFPKNSVLFSASELDITSEVLQKLG